MEGGNIWCSERGKRTRWVKVPLKVESIADTAERVTGRACGPVAGRNANVSVWLCFD
jgi:hypothetical protein